LKIQQEEQLVKEREEIERQATQNDQAEEEASKIK
jgi:hypothetical protein